VVRPRSATDDGAEHGESCDKRPDLHPIILPQGFELTDRRMIARVAEGKLKLFSVKNR
jgi:hypothetical protein